MVTRRNAALDFVAMVAFATLVVSVPQVEAQTADEQGQALTGEWTGVWPGRSGDTATLIVHEIDTEKGTAQCTYVISRKDTGTKQYPVLSDFDPSPRPRLELQLPYGNLTFVLKGKVLQGAFKGAHRGDGPYFENSIVMEKKRRE
jgi:hypothetical protein